MIMPVPPTSPQITSMTINPLLKQLEPLLKKPVEDVSHGLVEELALAISQILAGELSPVQTAILLHDMSLTGLEHNPAVLKDCSAVMVDAADLPDAKKLHQVIKSRNLGHGSYRGGLVDIVGTGGDNHHTFNVSTASSILASSLLLVAKHGNRASTSRSGASDVLSFMQTPQYPRLDRIVPGVVPNLYSQTNYGFLFAPNFHTGLAQLSGVRRELPQPSIFNLLGPLTNPANDAIEARIIGVKTKELVPVFAQALKLNGVKKAMVVCGDENLDEISCAGPTHCAWITDHDEVGKPDIGIQYFTLKPEDFGLPRHPLAHVGPGKSPKDNAEIMHLLLTGAMPEDDPVLHFVTINTAALFVVSGICSSPQSAFKDNEGVILDHGPAGGRWKEGARLAKQAAMSGKGWEMLKRFSEYTNTL